MIEPSCRLGYTETDLEEVFDHDDARLMLFSVWMDGQTMAICDGELYCPDHDGKEPSGCGPHGIVVYRWDLQRYLEGRKIVD